MSQEISPPDRCRKGVIENWQPEEPVFWQQQGKKVASRNLWI
ncbi:MAG: Nitrate/nitrite transporter NarK [Candidatus Erwinia impunctatus]|nr:Nitrate/nitrite transporter NarK [Culicoides impunctatus]